MVFVPGKPFWPSLMFVREARSLPLSVAPERCLTWGGSGLTSKYLTRLERLPRDNHSSLLRKSVNYNRKTFYSTGTRVNVIKLIKFPLLIVGTDLLSRIVREMYPSHRRLYL